MFDSLAGQYCPQQMLTGSNLLNSMFKNKNILFCKILREQVGHIWYLYFRCKNQFGWWDRNISVQLSATEVHVSGNSRKLVVLNNKSFKYRIQN